ncbi:Gfo/Idh/MocA family oxidoreductase [Paenibacillus thiaminolyticus]|uniref:Gfo/Idh/MocA family protein n=1 Tax=Paenibacillus thiaminolyticus TaxID=49283 RepID=UPI0013F66FAB|nr:Gfo/Idh/MocA family oxidoreductase [Paenibacillus thiaminolyticus]NGP57602.1 Gfo/Idh/MocA family oxidoreductase [Paenibacillus thiaminolyticus]
MNIALIGAGSHARRIIIPTLLFLGARISIVVDPDIEAGEFISNQFNCTYLKTVDEIKDIHLIDSFIVVTPPSTHSDVIKQLSFHKKPIFIEKPSGVNAQEISESIKICEEQKVFIQVGFMKRFAPVYNQSFQIVRKWDDLSIQGRVLTGPYSSNLDFLLDVGIHYIDLMYHFLGNIEKVVVKKSGNSHLSNWHLIFSNQHSMVASLVLCPNCTWGNPGESFWFQGNGQSITVKNLSEFSLHKKGREERKDDYYKNLDKNSSLSWKSNLTSTGLINHSVYLQGYLGELESFLQTARFHINPKVDLNDALKAVTLIEKMLIGEGELLCL